MPDVFLSYAHENRDFVAELADALRLFGWSVWWDEELSSRTQFPTEIEAVLAESSVVLVCWSRAAVLSRWVKEEANYGLENGKLLPIVIDRSSPPFGFQLVDTVNLEYWSYARRSRDLEPLVEAIAGFAGLPNQGRPNLMGRDDVLKLIRKFAQSEAGGSRTVLISGDPGVGKTSILSELRFLLEQEAVRCLSASGSQGATYPYQPIAESLFANLSAIDELADDVRLPLQDFLALGSKEDPISREELESHTIQGHSFYMTLARALTAFGEREQIALIFDDFQWFDPASIALLEYLTALTRSNGQAFSGVSFIFAFRPDELDETTESLIEQLRRSASTLDLPLHPLDDRSSKSLAEHLSGGRLTDDVAGRILSATRGNPLFINAVIEDAEARDLLRWRHGYLTMGSDSEFHLPKDVAHVIGRRMSQLGAGAQALLGTAAVWGRSYGIRVIGSLTTLNDDEVINALEELEATKFVEIEGDEFRFPHPIFQQVAYDRLSHARRQMLHAKVASYLGRIDSSDPSVIANHMLRAGDLVERPELMRICRLAGDRALKMYSWDDAVRFLRAFLNIAGADDQQDGETLARANHIVGAVCHRHGRPEEAIAHYERALTYWERTDDLVASARILDDVLRWHATFGHDKNLRNDLVARAERMVEQLDEDEAGVVGRLLETLATVYGLGPDPDKGARYAARSLEIALAHNDFELAARLSTAKALSSLTVLDPASAATAWEEGIGYADAIQDQVRRLRCIQRLPMPYLLLGRFDDVIGAVDRGEALNYALPRSGELSLALSAAASVRILQGDWVQADEVADRAIELIAESGYYWAAPTLLAAMMRKDLVLGDTSKTSNRFELVEDTPFARVVEPLRTFLSATETNEFTPLLSELSGVIARSGIDLNTMTIVGLLLEAATRCQAKVEPIAAVVDSLAAAVARGVRFSLGWPYSVERMIGVGYYLNDDPQSALRWLRLAQHRVRTHGARVELPTTLLYLSACESRLGLREASAHLAEGVAAANELGMGSYFESLRACLR